MKEHLILLEHTMRNHSNSLLVWYNSSNKEIKRENEIITFAVPENGKSKTNITYVYAAIIAVLEKNLQYPPKYIVCRAKEYKHENKECTKQKLITAPTAKCTTL